MLVSSHTLTLTDTLMVEGLRGLGGDFSTVYITIIHLLETLFRY